MLLFFTVSASAQTDSTTLHYGRINDTYLDLITQLEDIKFAEMIFSDTTMRGRRFFIFLDEYKTGF
ncbi:MAG: hypothetical protein D6677_08610 [Calditrichaeota bacterium]|nr:MAG: hypothetical protein D6677_08610 [Calditrichota bacterium]